MLWLLYSRCWPFCCYNRKKKTNGRQNTLYLKGYTSFSVHAHTYHVSLLQTGEMGLTQSVGEEGLRFEVWVRQTSRTKYCLTLQASSSEDREAWTHDIAQLLWTHAIHNTGEYITVQPWSFLSRKCMNLLTIICVVFVCTS